MTAERTDSRLRNAVKLSGTAVTPQEFGEHEKRLAGLIAADAELRVQPSILARETRERISIS